MSATRQLKIVVLEVYTSVIIGTRLDNIQLPKYKVFFTKIIFNNCIYRKIKFELKNKV